MNLQKANNIYFRGGGANALSNFAAFQVDFDGDIWPTAEHAYQAQKFTDEAMRDQIKNALSAFEAKKRAAENESKIRDDWFEVNVDIMRNILKAKLDQHEHNQEVLKRTGGKELIEDTEDDFWGCGKSGNGKNMLDKMWVKLRAQLQVLLSLTN